MQYIKKGYFVISGTILTAVLTLQGTTKQALLGVSLSFLILFYLVVKNKIGDNTYKDNNKYIKIVSLIFSLISSAYLINCALIKIQNYYTVINKKVELLVHFNTFFIQIIPFLLIIYSLYIYFLLIFNYCFTPIISFFKNLESIEKRFLIIINLILMLSVLIIYNCTNAFYSPTRANGELINYDIIYTSDTPIEVNTNVYTNISANENDIRQPLFGLYSFPFGIGVTNLAKIININNSYPIFMDWIQIFLLSVSILLLSRILSLNKKEKILFLLMNSLSYPFLLFSLNMEQYIFPVFWMILLIYFYIKQYEYRDLLYIGATGSMLTSGVLFPLLFSRSKKISDLINILFKTFIKFCAVTILFGQLPTFLNAKNSLENLMRFTGDKVLFSERFQQYTNFIYSCFFQPKVMMEFWDFAIYWLEPVKMINYGGVFICVISIIGFVLNHDQKIIRIAFLWVIFSFVLLSIIGWGTSENGLILYALYFSWAFIILTFMAINKIPLQKVKYISMVAICVCMFLFNLHGLGKMIEFVIKYYPIH